jgi:NDP-sugar pyrophosphorylase family protein
MKYLREYQALGTAGGLYHFRDAILKGHTDRFFVLNADVCCSFPLEQMLRLFEEKDGEAVILGTRVANDAATNFGCIVSDTHSKRVLHYVEKPESHISNLINCGVYLFSTEAFFPSIKSAMKRRADRPRLLSYPSSDTLDSSYIARPGQDNDDDGEKTEVIRLEQDILSDLADNRQFYVLETKDFWRQIKTAGSAVPANALYPSSRPSSSTLQHKSTLPRSSALTSLLARVQSSAPALVSRKPSCSKTPRSSTMHACCTPSSAGAAESAHGHVSRVHLHLSASSAPAWSRTE